MTRKYKTSMFNMPLIIIMILSLALPIATFFLKYMTTKDRYNVLQRKYDTRQKEFEQEVLKKLGQVDTIQRKRKIYDKVNTTLKSRQCTSIEMANEYLKEFVDKISSNRVKIQAKLEDQNRRSNLPGYDTVLRENIRVKASFQDFWRIMAQITRIGDEAFYCNNKECSQYEVKKLQEELENVKNCEECEKILTKGVIPIFYYIEKFKMNTRVYKASKELDMEFVIAVPVALKTEN